MSPGPGASHVYRLDSAGLTTPVYSYPGAVRETAWVDIGMDQDGDGVNDRVAVDIIRPAEPSRRHLTVPAILDVSGYYWTTGRGNDYQTKKVDAYGRPVRFPLFLDNYFVPRGYAVLLVDLAGTGRSSGCTDFMGPSEIASSTRVVDWLNKRAPGYSAVSGGRPVDAGWSDGKAGIIGKSWDGTTAYEAAASGVEGLEAAVAESGVTSPYTALYAGTGTQVQLASSGDYTVANRVQNSAARGNRQCRSLLQDTRDSQPGDGDYTSGWRSRDLVPSAGRVTAALLVAQGQIDTTVTPSHFGAFWSALPAHTPKKLWLSLAGHVDPFDYRRGAWVDTVHRWFDRYLYGIHNSVDAQPRATVERSPGEWTDVAGFPAATATATTLHLAGQTLQAEPAAAGTTTVLDGHGLEVTTAPLRRAVRLSGTPSVTVTLRPTSAANQTVTVELIDHGTATVRGEPGDTGITTSTTERDCFGGRTDADTGCFLRTSPTTDHVDSQTIATGVRDLRHATSIEHTNPVQAGHDYTVRIPLWPMDRVIQAGHRVGLLVTTTAPSTGLIDAGSALTLPVEGGAIQLW